MSTHYDSKGKTFTPVISTQHTPVTIQTTTNRIVGNMHLRENERLKDALNTSEDFIAITDAQILDLEGLNLISQAEFLAINRQRIVWVRERQQS